MRNTENISSKVTKEKNPEKTKKQRAYWSEHAKRSRQRKQLKLAVAKFCNNLQLTRGVNLDRMTNIRVNIKVNEILRLPYRWTQADLDRAFALLKNLELKYLKVPFTNIPKDESEMLDSFTAMLDNSKLDTATRVRVAYTLLKDEVEKEYLQQGDRMEPSPLNAYLFLSQDLQKNVPPWMDKQIIELLKEKYSGRKDIPRFLQELRNAINLKFMDENHPANVARELAEAENEI